MIDNLSPTTTTLQTDYAPSDRWIDILQKNYGGAELPQSTHLENCQSNKRPLLSFSHSTHLHKSNKPDRQMDSAVLSPSYLRALSLLHTQSR